MTERFTISYRVTETVVSKYFNFIRNKNLTGVCIIKTAGPGDQTGDSAALHAYFYRDKF